MRRVFSMLAAFAVIFASAAVLSEVKAADLNATQSSRIATALPPNCQELQRCGPDGCNTYRVCARQCPDGYSCAPLYGAYGPYGGVDYWGAYTDSGWDYRR